MFHFNITWLPFVFFKLNYLLIRYICGRNWRKFFICFLFGPSIFSTKIENYNCTIPKVITFCLSFCEPSKQNDACRIDGFKCFILFQCPCGSSHFLIPSLVDSATLQCLSVFLYYAHLFIASKSGTSSLDILNDHVPLLFFSHSLSIFLSHFLGEFIVKWLDALWVL